MKEISRYELYYHVRRIIRGRENLKVNEFIQNNLYLNDIELLDKILLLNITILEKIEEWFLITSNQSSKNMEELISQFSKNIEILNQNNDFKKQNEILKKFKLFLNKSKKDEFYFFNDLIHLLNNINNNDVKKVLSHIKMDKNYLNLNQVFLSYAFDDRLYTFCLFLFMLEHDIFLYVDWMWSGEIDDGIVIKNNLLNEIKKSDQLLFMRTINSEFNIRGSGNIRGWCSWELGAFYSVDKNNLNEKFYIELYRSKKAKKTNKQLDGIKPLKGVISGSLI